MQRWVRKDEDSCGMTYSLVERVQTNWIANLATRNSQFSIHYMTIHTTLTHILVELQQTIEQISPDQTAQWVDAIISAKRVFVAGAGRSGLQLRGFAMRLMHMGLTSFVVGEMVTPAIAQGDLLIIGSASGNTGSLFPLAQTALRLGAAVTLITTHADAPLARYASQLLVIPAPTPKSDKETGSTSIQPMGNLFEQSLHLVLDAITMELIGQLKLNSVQMFARHANLE